MGGGGGLGSSVLGDGAEAVAPQGIQPAEGGIEPIKSLIRELANPPERMAGRDPLLDRDVGDQRAAALLLASHPHMGSCLIFGRGGRVFGKLLTMGLSRKTRPAQTETSAALALHWSDQTLFPRSSCIWRRSPGLEMLWTSKPVQRALGHY